MIKQKQAKDINLNDTVVVYGVEITVTNVVASGDNVIVFSNQNSMTFEKTAFVNVKEGKYTRWLRGKK